MDKKFIKTLRLNILELLHYPKVRKNKKRLSDHDILGQIQIIYQVSERKPEAKEVAEAMIYLLDRSLIDDLPVGDVIMYTITDEGRGLLDSIYEGDDTAII